MLTIAVPKNCGIKNCNLIVNVIKNCIICNIQYNRGSIITINEANHFEIPKRSLNAGFHNFECMKSNITV